MGHTTEKEFLTILFRLYAAASAISKKLQNAKTKKKKIMHGRFNRFHFSLNAVLCTPQELYTQNYVCVDDL
jgi:hypothetical protein